MRYILFLLITITIISCDPNRIYEENRDMTNGEWIITEVPSFQFEIPDRDRKYNLYVNVRNSVAYDYHNIYFKYRLLDDGGTLVGEELINRDLFDQKNGHPLGSGVGDIFDHRLPLLENFTFSEPGLYTLELTQYMRHDTLQNILSVGLRVESSNEELDN